MMKLLIFLYKRKYPCDNDKRMVSSESNLINQSITVGDCLSVKTATLLTSVIHPRPPFYIEVIL